MRIVIASLALGLTTAYGLFAQEFALDSTRRADVSARLAPTAHPALPATPSEYWFVGEGRATAARGETAAGRLARGATLIADEEFASALALVNPAALTGSPLAPYAQYYRALALQGLSRAAEADGILTALVESRPEGHLREAAAMALADVALARGDGERAENLLEELAGEKLRAPEAALLTLAMAEESIGHRDHALDAYARVYYDFPLSTEATDAQEGIESLAGSTTLSLPDRFARELKRAEALFAARRWAQSRAAFQALAGAAQGDTRELIALRLAEADYYLDRHRAARTALVPYLDGSKREAEARFFHLTATRALGERDAYVRLARGLVDDYPDNEWAAETLNNLASHYITIDEDAGADPVFRELMRRFPAHRHAERAAWKTGWTSYRAGRFADAAEIFERAAAAFPRADNRPAWLYWSGRSRDRLGDAATANARYRLTVADYGNLYYGRLAARILEERREPLLPDGPKPIAPATATVAPTDSLIRALTAAGLYDDALKEVQYAQVMWGDSPQLLATSAWIRHQQGQTLQSMERFTALRGAITTMRRAYPQFMAAGGEQLPPDVLRIIYPLDYWPLITKYAKAHDLDPYLIAGLMAQESTFTADIRSAANAYGLMQLIPGTGRQVARQLGIRRFTTSMLTQPETNVRLGTKYFKDMVEQFGGVHYALAGYNAGPHRVVAWLKEAPGLPQDEFIDNIPFTETQAYVKRILGTAEDYRRLYGTGLLQPGLR